MHNVNLYVSDDEYQKILNGSILSDSELDYEEIDLESVLAEFGF